MYRALGTFALVICCSLAALSQATIDPNNDFWSSSKRTKFAEASDRQTLLASADAQGFPTSFSRVSSSKPTKLKPEKFQWGRAILESANFMAIQQGIMLGSDKWSRYELTHGKWFQTYMKAVRGNGRWDDGDPFLDNYVGHPMQGAITGYIQIQNDPAGRHLEFQNTHAYWKSRMKAMAWNAVYSAQFEIGPFGEASVQKLGSYQYRNCVPGCKVVNGAGMVDFVITPTVGTGWLVAEDMLDKYVAKKAENKFGRNGWTNLIRCLINPSRTAANMLDHKRPWYRSSRDEAQ
jgi:hypothetical protein